MSRRYLRLMFAIMVSGALAVFVVTGCGGDEKPKVDVQTPDQIQNALKNGSGEDFNQKLEELKKTEMSVEIIQNGESNGKWSQNSKGSWRWEDAADKTSYVIYNADKKKTWVVNGDTAIESSDTSQSQAYAGFNPALMMSSFGAMTVLPRTGGSDDTWEWEMPGSGKLTIEFKGPNGLVSKVIDEDYSTKKTDTTEFVFADLGSISSSLFELPSGVTVQSTDNLTGGLGTDTSMMPGGTGSSDTGGYTSGGGLYGGDGTE